MEGGANLVYGVIPEEQGEGNFFPAIIIEGVTEDNPVYQEEFFGPVFQLTEVDSDEAAVALAN